MTTYWLRKKELVINKLIIRRSNISGEGTYAATAIKKQEFIRRLSGELIVTNNIDEIIDERKLRIEDPLQIDVNKFLILDNESRLINHSCHPNAIIRNDSDLYALRDIVPGEEITYDYSTTSLGGPSNQMEMLCRCGAKNCRKIISDVFSLPPAVLEFYIEANALPDFIKKRIPQLEPYLVLPE